MFAVFGYFLFMTDKPCQTKRRFRSKENKDSQRCFSTCYLSVFTHIHALRNERSITSFMHASRSLRSLTIMLEMYKIFLLGSIRLKNSRILIGKTLGFILSLICTPPSQNIKIAEPKTQTDVSQRARNYFHCC